MAKNLGAIPVGSSNTRLKFLSGTMTIPEGPQHNETPIISSPNSYQQPQHTVRGHQQPKHKILAAPAKDPKLKGLDEILHGISGHSSSIVRVTRNK